MISRLSDLLRLTFDRSGAPRISLQEELEFLQKYLEIEQTRFNLSAGARAQLRSGVGLSNTRDRLECLYGEAHRIEFSDDTRGLAVRLQFPFQQAALHSTAAAFQVA